MYNRNTVTLRSNGDHMWTVAISGELPISFLSEVWDINHSRWSKWRKTEFKVNEPGAFMVDAEFYNVGVFMAFWKNAKKWRSDDLPLNFNFLKT